MTHPVPSLLVQAHEAVARVVAPGDLAVDATIGNGNDTLHLARRVGPSGRVLGLDLDVHAIERTRRVLREAGLSDRVELILGDHADLAQYLGAQPPGRRLRAVMFNLGYRPGGDRAVRTRPESTVTALRAAYDALDPPAILSVVTYVGHPGAAAEDRAVRAWAGRLDADDVGPRSLRPRVLESRFLHADHATGSLFLIGRARGAGPR